MAKNNLTPQQDIVTRQFYVLVAQTDALDPVERKRACRICLDLLNYYVTPDGRHLEKKPEMTRQIKYGQSIGDVQGEDEWLDDYKRALKAGGKDAQANNKDAIAPRRRKQTKNTKVRKTVLPEDV